MTQYKTNNVRHNAIVAYAHLMNVLSLVCLYRELEEVNEDIILETTEDAGRYLSNRQEMAEIYDTIQGSDYPEYVAYVS